MSIILDALRKSESERQRQAGAVITDAGYRSAARRRSPWLVVLAVALIANLAAFGVWWWRSEPRGTSAGAPPPEARAAARAAPPEPPVVRPAAAARMAGTEDVAVPAGAPVAAAPPPAAGPGVRGEVLEPPPEAPAIAASTASVLPTLEQAMASGIYTGPELHVDLHVYSRKPGERFAVINMKRYGEGAELAEGGARVEEITPDGVVLSQGGSRFLLTRE